MTHDEMIAVIEHHKKGGKVQCSKRTLVRPEWFDAPGPTWNFYEYDYRIKPEPVERWAVETSAGHLLFYRSKVDADNTLNNLHGAVRVLKMREVED